MNKRTSWFAKNAQQGVFMKIATIPSIVKTGPNQTITESNRPTSQSEKYFEVGQSTVGGKEVVGG